MKAKLIFITAISLLLITSFVHADDEAKEKIYLDAINAKITKCENKAVHMIESKMSNLRTSGLQAYDMANFYRRHKDELVRSMVTQAVNNSGCSIDYFLIKAYRDARGKDNLLAKYSER